GPGASPSGLPGQCGCGGCRPARRTPEQSIQVTMCHRCRDRPRSRTDPTKRPSSTPQPVSFDGDLPSCQLRLVVLPPQTGRGRGRADPRPRPRSTQGGQDMSEAIGQPGQAALPRPLGIGEILSTAWRLYQRHWRTLLAIAAVVVVPLTLLQYLLGDWIRTRGEVSSYQEISTATWAVGAAGLVAGLAGLLMYLVLTGAITRAVAAEVA